MLQKEFQVEIQVLHRQGKGIRAIARETGIARNTIRAIPAGKSDGNYGPRQPRRPERPGRFSFFPTAALVTAGARLMLALAQREVERLGGEVAYCDTDGFAVGATKDGGFIPCEGGPYRLADGTRAVRALSWAQLETLRERFATLNPYDREAVPGTILKLEDENFTDERRDQRCELYCYAVSEKLYTLFTLDARGEPVIRKYSSHVLGQYRSPILGDRHGWIIDAWKREIRGALGHSVEPFPWERYPAISQLTLTTWSVFKPYRENADLRPFDFLAVAIVNRSPIDLAIEEVAHAERCCGEPRPACALFSDLARWREKDWRCLRCGEPWDLDARPRLKTYASLIRSTLRGAERKRLAPDGSIPTRQTRGLLIPRPVRVEQLTPIGKEVIVDPTGTDEGLTAEMLGATQVLEYESLAERVNALRPAIRAIGLKKIAKAVGLTDRALRAIVNQGAVPRKSTVERLETVTRAKRIKGDCGVAAAFVPTKVCVIPMSECRRQRRVGGAPAGP
jgi:DNA-binding phage protein